MLILPNPGIAVIPGDFLHMYYMRMFIGRFDPSRRRE